MTERETLVQALHIINDASAVLDELWELPIDEDDEMWAYAIAADDCLEDAGEDVRAELSP